MRLRALAQLAVLLVACNLVVARVVRGQEISIDHASARAAYLAAGARAGLSAGSRLEVMRNGEVIALLEVVYATAETAACRIVQSLRPVVGGDLAVPLQSSAGAEPEVAGTDRVQPVAVPLPDQLGPRGGSGLRTDLSGSLLVRYQQRDGLSEQSPHWDDSTARLNLRASDIGGAPLGLSIRTRSRRQTRSFGTATPSTSQNDRVYELSLSYYGPNSPFWFQLGRIGSGSPVGAGYLDGVLAQGNISRRFQIGGFYGSDPDIDDDLFASEREKLGGFFLFNTGPRSGPLFAEVLLSGIGEYELGEVSREYLFLRSRLSRNARWSLYQQAEIDLNRGWRREVANEDYQLSNLSISTSYRFSRSYRVSLSLDQRRNYRDLETRELPEEVFDDLLREGARGTFYYIGPRGLNASLAFGYRWGEASTEAVPSLAGSIQHVNLFGRGFLLGLDFSGFRGEITRGLLVTTRARKYFKGGHDIGLVFGQSQSESVGFADPQELRWGRLEGSVQLPWRLFLLLEFEVGFGDERETRQVVQLGYRF